jgi:hypothetical protein
MKGYLKHISKTHPFFLANRDPGTDPLLYYLVGGTLCSKLAYFQSVGLIAGRAQS